MVVHDKLAKFRAHIDTAKVAIRVAISNSPLVFDRRCKGIVRVKNIRTATAANNGMLMIKETNGLMLNRMNSQYVK